MLFPKVSIRRLISALAVTSCLITGVSTSVWADSNPGLTIFSGVQRENLLRYYLDFGGRAGNWDRYRLRVPAKKMELGVAQFDIVYPDYYNGKFDTDSIEVRVKGESMPLSEVNWDQENHLLRIYLEQPIEAGNKVEIVLSDVKNPPFGGTFYFECRAWTPGDVPLPRYLGTWILTIN
ncbi:MAG TPA: hypothetical protein DDZ80_00750 [Cyanobacteria bacterium UBA8803]|nr:hypothetical protein [Cyanobacteria bacterium UBA9273]HBL57139.1 hypothetical protein [Cyanobacteria bacterium UBA8803]